MPGPIATRVYKKGRITGCIWDLVNRNKTDVHIIEENEGNEDDVQEVFYSTVDIVPPRTYPHDFGESGDSGSLVMSQNKSSQRTVLCRV